MLCADVFIVHGIKKQARFVLRCEIYISIFRLFIYVFPNQNHLRMSNRNCIILELIFILACFFYRPRRGGKLSFQISSFIYVTHVWLCVCLCLVCDNKHVPWNVNSLQGDVWGFWRFPQSRLAVDSHSCLLPFPWHSWNFHEQFVWAERSRRKSLRLLVELRVELFRTHNRRFIDFIFLNYITRSAKTWQWIRVDGDVSVFVLVIVIKWGRKNKISRFAIIRRFRANNCDDFAEGNRSNCALYFLSCDVTDWTISASCADNWTFSWNSWRWQTCSQALSGVNDIGVCNQAM